MLRWNDRWRVCCMIHFPYIKCHCNEPFFHVPSACHELTLVFSHSLYSIIMEMDSMAIAPQVSWLKSWNNRDHHQQAEGHGCLPNDEEQSMDCHWVLEAPHNLLHVHWESINLSLPCALDFCQSSVWPWGLKCCVMFDGVLYYSKEHQVSFNGMVWNWLIGWLI